MAHPPGDGMHRFKYNTVDASSESEFSDEPLEKGLYHLAGPLSRPPKRLHQGIWAWNVVLSIVYTVLSIGTIITLVVIYNSSRTGLIRGRSLLNGTEICGPTVDSAVKAGCRYDVLAIHWLPPACFDSETTRFSKERIANLTNVGLKDFVFYFDEERTQRATHDQMLEAGIQNTVGAPVSIPFYTDQVYHKAHCLHLWELQASAIRKASDGNNNVWLFTRVIELEHNLHCNQLMYDSEWDWSGGVDLHPSVGDCLLISQ